jgi:hypothetical protein
VVGLLLATHHATNHSKGLIKLTCVHSAVLTSNTLNTGWCKATPLRVYMREWFRSGEHGNGDLVLDPLRYVTSRFLPRKLFKSVTQRPTILIRKKLSLNSNQGRGSPLFRADPIRSVQLLSCIISIHLPLRPMSHHQAIRARSRETRIQDGSPQRESSKRSKIFFWERSAAGTESMSMADRWGCHGPLRRACHHCPIRAFKCGYTKTDHGYRGASLPPRAGCIDLPLEIVSLDCRRGPHYKRYR